MTTDSRRVFLPGPVPFVWSGVEYVEDGEGVGINARWFDTDDDVRTETFAQVSARCVVTVFDQVNSAGRLLYRYEQIEWR